MSGNGSANESLRANVGKPALCLHVKLATSCQYCVFVSMSASLRHPFLRDIVSKFAALFVAFGQQVAHRRSALMRLSSQVAHEVVCIHRIIMTLGADCFHYLCYCTIYFNCFLAIEAIDNMLCIAQFIVNLLTFVLSDNIPLM